MHVLTRLPQRTVDTNTEMHRVFRYTAQKIVLYCVGCYYKVVVCEDSLIFMLLF